MKACDNCPFLRTQVSMLRPARKREIAGALRRGGEFPCHKTLDYENDNGGARTPGTTFCGGALATMDNQGGNGCMENQMVRISARLGMINVDNIQGKELVFSSLRAFELGSDDAADEEEQEEYDDESMEDDEEDYADEEDIVDDPS